MLSVDESTIEKSKKQLKIEILRELFLFKLSKLKDANDKNQKDIIFNIFHYFELIDNI